MPIAQTHLAGDDTPDQNARLRAALAHAGRDTLPQRRRR